MTTIVTRTGKGSPLTHVEVDTNFTNLNTAKLEAGAIALGSAAAPSISFTGDTNTGIYSPGADQLAISTGGTGRLFVDASGFLGLGNSSPGDVLDAAAGNYRGITIKCQTTAHRPTLSFFNTTDSLAAYIQATGASLAFGKVSTDYGGHTESARIDSSGRLLVGTSSARSNFFNTTLTAGIQVEGTGGSTARGALSVVNNDSTNNPSLLVLGRSGAATLGSNSVLSIGDWIGTLSFQGADGTEFVEAASVAAYVDGTPGANDMPGRLVFFTTADGASSPTERFRIGSAGQLGIGGATYGTSGQVLTSGGASAAPSWQDAGGGAGTLKAWVNFNGTGTVAIRASGNVSSITDNGVGSYTVNFTTALADANYAAFVNVFPETSGVSAQGAGSIRGTSSKTTSAIGFGTVNYTDSAFADFQEVDVAIFR